MPRGPFTPLARQFRSVIVNLRLGRSGWAVHTSKRERWSSIGRIPYITRASFCATNRSRIHNASNLSQSVATAPEIPASEEYEGEEAAYRPFEHVEVENGTDSATGLVEAETSLAGLSPKQSKIGRVRSFHGQIHREEGEVYDRGYIKSPTDTKDHRFARVLKNYIRNQEASKDTGEAEWMTPFELLHDEQALLESRGYVLNNFKEWAEVVTTEDSFQAATKLEALRTKHGLKVAPVFVLVHLLGRPYLSAQALRILMRLAWATVDYHNSLQELNRLEEDDIFILFERIFYHARVVWPIAIESLPDLVLHYLPHNPPTGENSIRDMPYAAQLTKEQLENLTYRLNKAMRIIAMRTAVNPFKNYVFQEAAIVRILRFMAEHDPPLGINRDGYRAVILVQLAQPKSPTDQQWAELKALSWPPWKEERTAMDADITVEHHGMSKAAETLKRMKEAGYQHLEWERAASIYAGWDLDSTPTIQTRVLFSSFKEGHSSGAAAWTARITATRTVQEAWACYLAYEDDVVAPDQDVYLAIFRKLYEEGLRLQNARKYAKRQPSRPHGEQKLWPGDTMEVEPLPPSTHLHTYTRTPVPTLTAFYRQLRERGVVFEDHCLAFLVARANTLTQGIQYLCDSASRYPSVHGLLFPDWEHDLSVLPQVVVAAFFELLGRFSNVPLSKALPPELKGLHKPPLSNNHLVLKRKLNPDHPLVHAVDLLRRLLPQYRPMWNSVARALGHESSYLNLWAIHARYQFKKTGLVPKQLQGIEGASLTAYRLMARVRSFMWKEAHLDLDIAGFQALCHVVENATIGCWNKLRKQGAKAEDSLHVYEPGFEGVTGFMVRSIHVEWMKDAFTRLVGAEAEGDSEGKDSSTVTGLRLPRLLEVPPPAVLHTYIRALGWAADYQGLQETVSWMTKYAPELAEKRRLDRNGNRAMRNVIIALRVLLEREWVSPVTFGEEPVLPICRTNKHWFDRNQPRKQLQRLEAPAPVDLVQEIRLLVENVEEWGGWPTDEEVEEYSRHNTSKFERFE